MIGGAPEPDHQPIRGDAVEAWIKYWRDGYAGFKDSVYVTLDDMLDDYRLAADTGQTLRQVIESPDDPTQ